ncbi:arf-GAP with Rho-GAP domain, ANK repeat and PH domain-containing protein 2 isoform X2 [Hyla sarda]|uniref:arf-GAP with Rho-GAP domain, ANK repeat and PH domain-containing protein 2 isoform X2 n=1 Tax=Hyla sarda TaxID=327740 RepID=UPI0024C39BE9|nr:arf-GAP with Rho-GAP domain, ANK repeat and PH domain-containing protein 2 isoform X2 [Hyla sarda]
MASDIDNKYPVDQMLTDIHLEIYQSIFSTLGYRTFSDCAQLNHERLQEMGVSLTGHRKRILKKIQDELEKDCRDLDQPKTEKEMTSQSILSISDEDRAIFGEEFIAIDSEVNNLLMEYSTATAVDYGMHEKTGDGTSIEHNGHEKNPEPCGESCDKTLDYQGQEDTEHFFEFQGPMIDNELYQEMNLDFMKKTKVTTTPTRSFILRNRPVPDLPFSTFYNVHPTGTADSYPGGKKEQSGEENIPPISPYEETFFFRHSESTEEIPCDTISFSSSSDLTEETGRNTSMQNISERNTDLSLHGSSEESIYSTLEESNIKLGTTMSSNEDTQRQLFQDTTFQNDTLNQNRVESATQNSLSFQEDSITPYACFYEPYAALNKAGWLDKLSPHSCMFQKRWVKVDGHHISYYYSDRDVFSRGKILLSAVLKTQKLGDNKFEVVTSQKTLVFRTEKEGHRNVWIKTFQNALGNQAEKTPVLSIGDKSGYLELKGFKNKIFIVVNGRKVWLSKSKQDFITGIAITDIALTIVSLKNADRKNFEIITPFRTFCFTAESEREKQEWIEALQQSIAETVADYEVAEKIWFNESNRSCADCRAPNPDWASINLSVVICKDCAGQHKTLGSKVSKVHSLKLDSTLWSNELVELFIVLGNEKVNSFWEASLLPENMLCVTSTINQRRLFVAQKYKEGRFKKMLSPSPTPQQLNEALCAAVTKPDVLETMMLVFSGADVMCTTGDPINSTPYLLAKMAGQRLQMEFLHHNKFSDYKSLEDQSKNENMSYCGFLYKAPSSSSKMSTNRKLKEEMKKWWCTIENSLLSFYEDENQSVPEEFIDLSEAICLDVHSTEFTLNARAVFTFEIYLLSERMFLFKAENAESHREWARAISKNFVPTVDEHLTDLEFDLIGYLYYKDTYSLMEWKESWFALENACLHYSHGQENAQRDIIYLKKLQELTRSSTMINGEKRNVVILVENGRTLYIHGHTMLDFMVWHHAIEKAAGTDGNALQDQQLCKNNIPIIVNSCMAFVTQYGLGSKSLYLKNGNPLKVKELLEDFKKDARSIKLKVGRHQLEDVTDVLKCFLYEIDDALLTKELYPYWISALDIPSDHDRVIMYKTLIDTLPALNKTTLAALIEHLYRIQKCSDVNHLDSHYLAKAFAPCLFQTNGIHNAEVRVVEEMIQLFAAIFNVSQEQLQQIDIENRFITKWNDIQIQIPQSGDLLLEVFLERKDLDMCVIIRVSPNMGAAELTTCVAGIRNISLSKELFWTTFEVIANGELERPMHYKENVLATVLEWSMLPDPGAAYLLVKPFYTSHNLCNVDRTISRHIQSGNLKYKEDSSKLLSGNKFQEKYIVLRERKLLIYKDIKSIKPDKELPVVPCKVYIGIRKKLKPPTRFGLTICLEKHQWYLCCDSAETQMEWLISILNVQYAGDLFPRRRNDHIVTMKNLQMYEKTVKSATGRMHMPTLGEKITTMKHEELSSTIQQRLSMLVDALDYKEEERLTNQKKHYSLFDLDSPKNYGEDTRETQTMNVKGLHNPTDAPNKDLSSYTQLPKNVIKELNLVLQKSKNHRTERE